MICRPALVVVLPGMVGNSASPFCPRCGAANATGSAFCGYCGTPLASSVAVGTPLATGSPPPPVLGGGAPPYPAPYAATGPAGPSPDQQSTLTGLLLSAIGFALSWIPLLDVVGAILVLIGLIYIFSGRRGFGPQHRTWVVRATTLYLAGWVGTAVAIGVLVWLEFAAVSSLVTSSRPVSTGFPGEITLVFVAVGVLGVLGALARVLLVYALADERTLRLLWIAFAVAALIAVVATAEAAVVLGSGTISLGALQTYTDASYALDLAGAVPAIMFAWAYYHIRGQRTGPRPAGSS